MSIFKAYFHQKIFSKLLLSFLLIGIFPLFLSGITFYAVYQRIILNDIGNRTYESAGFVSSLLDDMITREKRIFASIESDPSFNKIFNSGSSLPLSNSDKAELYNKIYLLLAEKSPKAGIYVISADGAYIFSNKQIPGDYNPVQYKNWGIFRKAATAGGKIVIYPYKMYNREKSARVISLGKAVFSGDTIAGYIIVDLYQSHFTTLLSSVNNPEMFKIIGKNLLPLFSLTDNMDIDKVIELLKEIPSGNRHYIPFENNNQRLLFSSFQSKKTRLRIAAIQPLNQLLNVSNVVSLVFFILAGVTTVFGFILAFFVARNFSRPIYNVIQCVKQVENGDFTVRTNIKRKDEFAILGNSINAMILKLQELITNIKQKERSLRVAEMEALQAQIHPHMIFNTLEMIKWNIRMDKKDEAAHILIQFSKLLRQGIDNKDEMVTVREEMDVVGIYLDIQKHRFDERLKVEMKIDPEIEKARIPKYIIQPIVENSIVHGLRDKMGIMKISIRGYGEGRDLLFEISDNGKGMDDETVRRILEGEESYGSKSNSTGIRNVLKRIKLYYGSGYGLSIESIEGRGTKIILKMQNSVII